MYSATREARRPLSGHRRNYRIQLCKCRTWADLLPDESEERGDDVVRLCADDGEMDCTALDEVTGDRVAGYMATPQITL